MKRFFFIAFFFALAFTASAQVKFVDELPHREKTVWIRSLPADTTACYIITAEGI